MADGEHLEPPTTAGEFGEAEGDEDSGFGTDDFDDDGDEDWGDDFQEVAADDLIRAHSVQTVDDAVEEMVQVEGGEAGVVLKRSCKEMPAPPARRCWVCPLCGAYNSLLMKGDGNYRCVQCSRPYNVAEDRIISAEAPDYFKEEEKQEEFFQVWRCSMCTYLNDMAWSKCRGCYQGDKDRGEVTYSEEKPKNPGGDAGFGFGARDGSDAAAPAAGGAGAPKNYGWYYNQAQQRHAPVKGRKWPRKVDKQGRGFGRFGKVVSVESFPGKPSSAMNSVLERVFGTPRPMPQLRAKMARAWTRDGVVSARVGFTSAEGGLVRARGGAGKGVTEVHPRGFALNDDGWAATLTNRAVQVWRPVGAGYELFWKEDLPWLDMGSVGVPRKRDFNRLRFVDDTVAVFQYSSKTVHAFRLRLAAHLPAGERLANRATLQDTYMRKSHVIDVAMLGTDHLAIVFDRWLGVYEVDWDMGALSWLHAVAFADQPVDTTSIHMARTGFAFLCSEYSLIGFHGAWPDFSFLYAMDTVDHNQPETLVASADRFGVFVCDRDRRAIRQSPMLDHSRVTTCFRASPPDGALPGAPEQKEADEEAAMELVATEDLAPQQIVDEILAMAYDESFGVSGRLLVHYAYLRDMDHLGYAWTALVDLADLGPLRAELKAVQRKLPKHPGSPHAFFNLHVAVYEYLYGDDFVASLVEEVELEDGQAGPAATAAAAGELAQIAADLRRTDAPDPAVDEFADEFELIG